jgi:hypothetical protein
MKKTFKDGVSTSREEARFIGIWDNQANAFESTTIYMTHLVRLEGEGKVSFVYDPGKVERHLKLPNYPLLSK